MTDAFAPSASSRPARSARTIMVDNLLRKTLRVADPHNAEQIANALLARYPEDAERDRRERAGLPYSSLGDARQLAPVESGASGYELRTARDDLERDLLTLTTFSQLKEISVELVGWGRAVRAAAADGLAAARLALDANNHDIAMASRRTLYEYARLARFVGALSEGSSVYFRRFAQSCDVLAALILVGIGDGLAASGITRSTALIRVAASELQSRRNAVIGALRALTGSIESPLGQEDYPRGIIGYQMLVRQLEGGGQSDLRALLEENALAAAMDQLVDLTGGSSVDSLRELSTSAAILLQRFQRLIQYGASVPIARNAQGFRGDAAPESPPLLAFVASLQLFVDAFAYTGGSRLLRVARPPILAYGLYGSTDQAPSRRLIELTLVRGQLVDAIDCYAACGCSDEQVALTVLLDFTLLLFDRAIDLWAVGTDPDGRGDPERRALIAVLFAQGVLVTISEGFDRSLPIVPQPRDLIAALDRLQHALGDGFFEVIPDDGYLRQNHLFAREQLPSGSALVRELRGAFSAELQTERLARNLATGCAFDSVFNRAFTDGFGTAFPGSLIRSLLHACAYQFDPATIIDPPMIIDMPQTLARSAAADVFGDSEFGHG